MRDTRSLSLSKLTSEEKLRLAKETRLQSILGKYTTGYIDCFENFSFFFKLYFNHSTEELRKKDEEQATLFEQKMALHMRLHDAINFPSNNESDPDKDKDFKDIPDYLRLVRGDGINATQMWQEVCYIFTKI